MSQAPSGLLSIRSSGPQYYQPTLRMPDRELSIYDAAIAQRSGGHGLLSLSILPTARENIVMQRALAAPRTIPQAGVGLSNEQSLLSACCEAVCGAVGGVLGSLQEAFSSVTTEHNAVHNATRTLEATNVQNQSEDVLTAGVKRAGWQKVNTATSGVKALRKSGETAESLIDKAKDGFIFAYYVINSDSLERDLAQAALTQAAHDLIDGSILGTLRRGAVYASTSLGTTRSDTARLKDAMTERVDYEAKVTAVALGVGAAGSMLLRRTANASGLQVMRTAAQVVRQGTRLTVPLAVAQGLAKVSDGLTESGLGDHLRPKATDFCMGEARRLLSKDTKLEIVSGISDSI